MSMLGNVADGPTSGSHSHGGMVGGREGNGKTTPSLDKSTAGLLATKCPVIVLNPKNPCQIMNNNLIYTLNFILVFCHLASGTLVLVLLAMASAISTFG